jgi:hypothetical protein
MRVPARESATDEEMLAKFAAKPIMPAARANSTEPQPDNDQDRPQQADQEEAPPEGHDLSRRRAIARLPRPEVPAIVGVGDRHGIRCPRPNTNSDGLGYAK